MSGGARYERSECGGRRLCRVRTGRLRWAALLAALMLALSTPALWVLPAQAHALLVRSVPTADSSLATAPQVVEFWFTEPLEPRFSTARLLDSTGAEVATGAAMVDLADPTHMTLPLTDLPPGIYTVVWRTLSRVDGHEWVGSFPMTVLNTDGTRPEATAVAAAEATRGELPNPLEVAVRWLSLLGVVGLLGAPIFQAVVLGNGRRDSSAAGLGANVLLRPLLFWTIFGAALAMIAGGWLQIAVQSLAHGGLHHAPALLLQTRAGNLVLYREVLAAAAVLVLLTGGPAPTGKRRGLLAGAVTYASILFIPLLWVAVQMDVMSVLTLVLAISAAILAWIQARRADVRASPVSWWMLLVLGAWLAAAFSVGSHAGAVAGSGWAVIGDWVHLAAAAAWLGGLLLLAALLWAARATAVDPGALPTVVRRFSLLAAAAVFVLGVSGLFGAVVQLPSVSALWMTVYGRVLLVKLLLVLLALAIAWLNNRTVASPSGASPSFVPETWGRLRRRVALEAAVATVVLVAVAVLVQTPAPVTPASPPIDSTFNDIIAADDLLIHVQVSPNQVGNNRFWLHLYHSDGSSIGEVQLVRLLFTHQEQELGQGRVDLMPLGQDTFAVEGAYLNLAGPWNLSIYVRRRGFDDLLTNLSVTVPTMSSAAVDRSPWQNPAAALPVGVVGGGFLVSLGMIPFLWWRRLRRNHWVTFPAVATVGGLAIVTGALLGYLALPGEATPAKIAGEPPPVTAESVAAGGELYRVHCADCHGLYGLGNGPASATLPVAPAVLVFHVPQHNGPELYTFISNGFPALGMPVFGERLSREEIWQIVQYLRESFG